MRERFRLDPDRLDALALALRAAALSDLQPARTGLVHVARGLEASWTAEAQRRFQNLFGNWIGELDRLGAELARVEVYLATCAAEYRRLDGERAGAILGPPDQAADRAADRAVHVVRAGDSLWRIATHYGVTVDALRRANGLTGDVIVPGQVLRLPVDQAGLDPGHGQDPPGQGDWTVEVQPGDTLSALAQRYGTTIEALMQANGLRDSRIYAGQGLRIPRPPTAEDVGAGVPDLAWSPEASAALSADQIARAEAAVDQLRRAPLDFIPAYLDPSQQAETFAALADYARYGAVGQGVEVGTLIWQAVGDRHGDLMANVLQQAQAYAQAEPGSILAAIGEGETLILSGPRVVDLHHAWANALPEPIDLGLEASGGTLTVRGDALIFDLTTPAGPYSLVLQIRDDGLPVVVDRHGP